MKKSFILALMNVKNYRVQNKLFCVILFFCMALFIMTLTISDGFAGISEGYKTDDISLREVNIWSERASGLSLESMKQIASRPEVTDAAQFFNVELDSSYDMSIDGAAVKCLPMMRGSRRGFSFVPEAEIIADEDGNNIEPLVCGREFGFSDRKKAIIDENMCYLLGYSEPSELLGKKVSIRLSDVLVNGIEIVGVCSYQYGYFYCSLENIDDFSRKGYLDSELCNPVFFSDDIISYISESAALNECYYENFRILVDNTGNVRSCCRDITDTYDYQASNLIYEIETKAREVRSAAVLLYIVTMIVFMAAVFSIINTLIIKIDNQKKYSDMLLKIGYKRRNISLVYLFENFILSVRTGIAAFIVSLVLSVLTDALFYKGYSVISVKEKYIFLIKPEKVCLFTLIIIAFVAVVTLLISSAQLKRIGRTINNGR